MPERYEMTRRGEGFQDRHPTTKVVFLNKLRDRIKALDEPYHFSGDAHGLRYNVEGAMEFIRNHLDGLKPYRDRIVISGDSYDQPDWVVRAVEVEPKAPMAEWLEKFIGQSSYGGIGAEGPPGPSDCSSATRNAAKAAHGIELPHGADLQMKSDKMRIFHDSSLIEPDDFIFYNYGRLDPWDPTPDVADHVELIRNPNDGKLGQMRAIGSRPSTHGVSYYIVATWDSDNILGFGRLK